jgi:hypothetical protein
VGAKELQLSIQGISISSASLADPLDVLSPLATPAPASHARLRHALSWIRGKQLPSSSAAAAEAAVDLGATLAPSDGMQLLYNTGACACCRPALRVHRCKCRVTPRVQSNPWRFISAPLHTSMHGSSSTTTTSIKRQRSGALCTAAFWQKPED